MSGDTNAIRFREKQTEGQGKKRQKAYDRRENGIDLKDW